MSLTREEGWALLETWTPSAALRTHARSVEVVMRAAALHYGPGQDAVEAWGLAGMLHDADYDQWPETHPKRIMAWLEERGESELAHAISCHYTKWGVTATSPMDKALLACDELTGFVGACCLVRPEGIATLTPKSIKKKLKSKGFAAKVDREEVAIGMQLLEVDPSEHIQFVIDALKPFAEGLGIGAS